MPYDPQALGAQCHRCPLNHETPVPPQAPADGRKPKLIIIGEGPGRLEERDGIPFVGPSGRMLNSALREAGFDRADAFVTNVIACRPESDNDVKAAAACCAPRLANELKALDKTTPILALGSPATKLLLGRAGVLRARGFVWHAPEIKESQLKSVDRLVEHAKSMTGPTKSAAMTRALDSAATVHARKVFEGRIVVPSLHPAFILRGADGWLPLLRIDVARIVRWVETGGFPLEDEGPFKIPKSPAEAASLLAKMSDLVTVDIETDGDDPIDIGITCVGIADIKNIRRAVVIDPWKPSYGPVLAKALRGKTVVGHNLMAFDEIALAKHGIKITSREDTLVAHHAFASHFPQGLAHLGSVYCQVSPWKTKFKTSEEKGAVAGFGVAREDLAVYNYADIAVQALCWRRMQKDLAPERHVYEADMKMAAICQKMQIAGMRVDEVRRAEIDKALRYRAAALLGEMRELTKRRGFHPSRLGDVRKALFHDFKAPTYLAPPSEKTGIPSTGVAVLEALRSGNNRAAHLADLIIRWRASAKVRSTFVQARSEDHPRGIRIHKDGRVHPSWKSFGTVTGRISCRNPNLMNLPRQSDAIEDQVRSMYVAAKGCEFVYFDIQQSEMRAAALISADDAFLASCASGDVHTANACILFPFAKDILLGKDLDEKQKKLRKKLRDICKNAGFGILYLAEADTVFQFLLSRGFDVTLDDVVTMFGHIHNTYSRYYEFVEQNIQECRRNGFLRTVMLGRKRFMGFYPRPTEISNFKVQSFIADLMNARMVEIDKKVPSGCKLVAQIHDASIYECRVGRAAASMTELIKDVWGPPVDLEGLKPLVFPIDIKRGDRWSTLE